MSPQFSTRCFLAIAITVACSFALPQTYPTQSLTSPHQMTSDEWHPSVNADDNAHQSNEQLTNSHVRPVSLESGSAATKSVSPDISENKLSATKAYDSSSGVPNSQLDSGKSDVSDGVGDGNGVLGTVPNDAISGAAHKRSFDSIHTNSAFSSFGKRQNERTDDDQLSGPDKRRFDSIGNSAFTGFGKRRFDSISGKSAFTGFGKRRLDSIGNSAFRGFGKRGFDSIGNSAFTGFGKRGFDSIGNSAFTGFGKRGFDSIGNSAFTGFGKRGFDSIGNSAFTGFGKRRFDSIGNSAFTGFGKRDKDSGGEKRGFDSISNSAFTGFGKRRFDSIGSSAFTGFGKRCTEEGCVELSALEDTTGNGNKKAFDSLSAGSAFHSFGKRNDGQVDIQEIGAEGTDLKSRKKRDVSSTDAESESDSHNIVKRNSLGNHEGDLTLALTKAGAGDQKSVSKRTFDSIDHRSDFSRFGKRRFDSIDRSSAFSGFGKRRFDPIDSSSSFAGFGKRKLDSIDSSAFSSFGKRKFDSIAHRSSFGGFGKRSMDNNLDTLVSILEKLNDEELIKLALVVDNLEASSHEKENNLLDIVMSKMYQNPTGAVSKRRFDSIDSRSVFRRFGRLAPSRPMARIFDDDTSVNRLDTSEDEDERSNKNIILSVDEFQQFKRLLLDVLSPLLRDN